MSIPNPDRPAPLGDVSLSEKENHPMIAIPLESFAEVRDALDRQTNVVDRLVEILERLFPKEEVKEEPVPVPIEWLTVDEAAKELKRSPYQIRELCRRKVFGQKDSGGKWWIHRKDIEHFRNGRTLIHGEEF
jgi:hypothetical protein